MNAVETKDRSEANHWPEFVADDFERAARGPDMAYHLSTAIDVLRRHAVRDAPSISTRAMFQIMMGIASSRSVAIMLLSGDTERFLATHAILETAELAAFWGANPSERHRWPPALAQNAVLSAGFWDGPQKPHPYVSDSASTAAKLKRAA